MNDPISSAVPVSSSEADAFLLADIPEDEREGPPPVPCP